MVYTCSASYLTRRRCMRATSSYFAMPWNVGPRRRARRIGIVFQLFHLILYLNVEENIHATSAAPIPQAQERAPRYIYRGTFPLTIFCIVMLAVRVYECCADVLRVGGGDVAA